MIFRIGIENNNDDLLSSLDREPRISDTYLIESFFVHEWKPLIPHEIERARKLLAWSRADLMSLLSANWKRESWHALIQTNAGT